MEKRRKKERKGGRKIADGRLWGTWFDEPRGERGDGAGLIEIAGRGNCYQGFNHSARRQNARGKINTPACKERERKKERRVNARWSSKFSDSILR